MIYNDINMAINGENEYGYCYCLRDISLTGYLKFHTSLGENLMELDRNGMPSQFIIKFSKKVFDPMGKLNTINTLLEHYSTKRIMRVFTDKNNNMVIFDFFHISLEKVKLLFKLMDGELYENDDYDDYDESYEDNEEQEEEEEKEEEDEEEEEDEDEEDEEVKKYVFSWELRQKKIIKDEILKRIEIKKMLRWYPYHN
jgi:hypothetical protein